MNDPLGETAGLLEADSPDRQILVVGRTTAGLAACALLYRASFDPVIVQSHCSPTASKLAHLWPESVRRLETLGLEPELATLGETVKWVSVESRPQPREPQIAGKSVQLRTRKLQRILADRLPEDSVETDRYVAEMNRQERGVQVTFDDGVSEWFDVVVDARPGGASPETPETGLGVAQTEYRIETRATGEIREIWHPQMHLQVFPAPDGAGGLLRYTTDRRHRGSPIDDRMVRRVGSELLDHPLDEAHVESQVIEQSSTHPGGVRSDAWGSDRLGRCGPAAYPVAPASGLREELAIEDAWTLAATLGKTGRSVPEAIEEYGRRRRRRVAKIGHQSSQGDRQANRAAEPDALAAIRQLRREALVTGGEDDEKRPV